MSSLFELVGNTPLVEMTGISPCPTVKIYAKMEMYNPTASVKARAAAQILERGEQEGRITKGSTILDASSGNTGIAYAAFAAAKGYRLKLCVPKNINAERKALLMAYGVECIYTSLYGKVIHQYFLEMHMLDYLKLHYIISVVF